MIVGGLGSFEAAMADNGNPGATDVDRWQNLNPYVDEDPTKEQSNRPSVKGKHERSAC